MDSSTGVLLGVVAVMGANQVLMRLEVLRRSGVLFWGMQAINMVVACGVLLYGLPGFESVPAVNWMLGLLFLWRTIQNNGLRDRWMRDEARKRREAQRKSHGQGWLDALEKGEQVLSESEE